MFTEDVIVDLIQVLRDGQIQIREARRVLKDGVVIAQTFHRYVLDPGAADPKRSPLDVLVAATSDQRVLAVAQALWTPAVIADRQAALSADAEASRAMAVSLAADAEPPAAPLAAGAII